MSIRVKEENQELMLLVLEHSISGSSMKDLQNELDMIKVVMLVEAQFGVTFSVSEPFEKEKLVAIHFLVDSIQGMPESCTRESWTWKPMPSPASTTSPPAISTGTMR